MFHHFSLQKSATSFSLLLFGATASLLGTQLLDKQLVEPATNQWLQANTSVVTTDNTLNAITDITNPKPSTLLSDSSTNTTEVAEKVGGAGTMLGIAAVVGSAAVVVLSARKVNQPFNRTEAPLDFNSGTSLKSKEDTIRIDQASRKLQNKLLRLLHDDGDTANRLLSQVKMKNPNKPINWCVEKVIYDLERDRRSY